MSYPARGPMLAWGSTVKRVLPETDNVKRPIIAIQPEVEE
jgi:hypothetical protein